MEYEILMGLETAKLWDKAVEDHVYFLKNPIQGPQQKWFTGYGFYKVLTSFNVLEPGNVILIDRYTHTRIVKIATPTQKQVFLLSSEDFNTRTKYTPENWFKLLRPLTPKEIYNLLPHMSKRIKVLAGYSAFAKSLPDYLCTPCMVKFNVEAKEGWGKHKLQRRCNGCGINKAIVTPNSAFKPIGR